MCTGPVREPTAAAIYLNDQTTLSNVRRNTNGEDFRGMLEPMLEANNEQTDPVTDDALNQDEARGVLRDVCTKDFGSDLGKAAIALGRPADQLESMLSGETVIDDDIVIKARGLSQER